MGDPGKRLYLMLHFLHLFAMQLTIVTCSSLSCRSLSTADYHGYPFALAWSTKHYEPYAACCRDLYDSHLAQLACPATASRAVIRLVAFCQQSEQPVFLVSSAESIVDDR